MLLLIRTQTMTGVYDRAERLWDRRRLTKGALEDFERDLIGTM